MFCLHVYVPHVCLVPTDVREAFESLEMKSQSVVSHYMGAGKQTQIPLQSVNNHCAISFALSFKQNKTQPPKQPQRFILCLGVCKRIQMPKEARDRSSGTQVIDSCAPPDMLLGI